MRFSFPTGFRRLFITLASGIVIFAGTVIAIQFAKGYRPDGKGILSGTGVIQGTGLLSANSFPRGAQVYINGTLRTATDNTLNLIPGSYDLEIKKDGFYSWKKTVIVEKELVIQTNARLFPTAPELTPLTFTGADRLTPSADGQKIAFFTASSSSELKNGLYVYELSDNFLSLQKGARQILQPEKGFDLSTAEIVWSPDSSQLLIAIRDSYYVLDSSKANTLATLQPATSKLPTVFAEWEEELARKEHARLALFPTELQRIATTSATNVYVSPDEDRLLYTMISDDNLANALVPPVPASNSQPQARELKMGSVYVYDRKEDRNFFIMIDDHLLSSLTATPLPKSTSKSKTIATPQPAQNDEVKKVTLGAMLASTSASKNSPIQPASAQYHMLTDLPVRTAMHQLQAQYSGLGASTAQWFPDSKHLILPYRQGTVIVEYDGTNATTVYNGPISSPFVFPWPNSSKLVILANFNVNEGGMQNMYAVGLGE
ncbi:MAG: hypothetical protein UX04_C0011G0001 [Microgenomates group bacterium GW2011_GWF2_45_18]|nr:MAG: hypothetical protein UW18_C0008G0001 [Microgenomates group bacterium GW2011_GWF1_44_10]KKU01337.1 MAG: hypothetical protein UX04_C0011G0001 [Microgenomates group bacterium GW2011_GWF2_45_18]